MANGRNTFQPDRRAGLENIAGALSRVLDFTLQQKQQQEAQRQALEQMKFLQQKEDERLSQKLASDFANLKLKMEQDADQFRQIREFENKRLQQQSREKELQSDIDHLRKLRELESKRQAAQMEQMRQNLEKTREFRDINLINAANSLFPTRDLIDLYQSVITSQNPAVMLNPKLTEDLKNEIGRQLLLKKQFLESQGVELPAEQFGPFQNDALNRTFFAPSSVFETITPDGRALQTPTDSSNATGNINEMTFDQLLREFENAGKQQTK